MVIALMHPNQHHFGQSKACTLTSPPLDLTMKFSATCEQADAILQGTLLHPPLHTASTGNDESDTDSSSPHNEALSNDSNSSTDPDDDTNTTDNPPHQPLHLQHTDVPELFQMLIDSFRYATTPDTIKPEITEAEYKGKLKAWNEGPSTSPTSNMHLGHLKAYWCEHTLPQGSKEAKLLEDIRKTIHDGHLMLINYAIHFGYSYEKWKSIVNTMLEKDKGIPKMHRLRVIHLYEADYNLILGIKWWQVLHLAASQGLINKGCYGSHLGKKPQMHFSFAKWNTNSANSQEIIIAL